MFLSFNTFSFFLVLYLNTINQTSRVIAFLLLWDYNILILEERAIIIEIIMIIIAVQAASCVILRLIRNALKCKKNRCSNLECSTREVIQNIAWLPGFTSEWCKRWILYTKTQLRADNYLPLRKGSFFCPLLSPSFGTGQCSLQSDEITTCAPLTGQRKAAPARERL